MKIIDRLKKKPSSVSAHYDENDAASSSEASRELRKEIGLIRKHLDNISEKVACILGEAEPEPEPTVTIRECEQLNEYLEIEKPYDRWNLLALFFALHKSEPELQRQLISIFCIDYALHMVETEEDAESKRNYPEAYHGWDVLVEEHRQVAEMAKYIRSNCTDGFHTAFLSVFNHMNSCIEDKMVYLWAYFTRGPLPAKQEEMIHRGAASMEWLYADPNRLFPDLEDDGVSEPDDA